MERSDPGQKKTRFRAARREKKKGREKGRKERRMREMYGCCKKQERWWVRRKEGEGGYVEE